MAHSNLLDDTSVKGDLVLANITADVLKILAKDILKNVKDNGKLIMSGIIHSRYDEVLQTYTELGFELVEKRVKGEWIAMAMKK